MPKLAKKMMKKLARVILEHAREDRWFVNSTGEAVYTANISTRIFFFEKEDGFEMQLHADLGGGKWKVTPQQRDYLLNAVMKGRLS